MQVDGEYYILDSIPFTRVSAAGLAASVRTASRVSPSADNKVARAMARIASVLPPSISPHICIISSPDLADVLSASSLPPLPQVLQSFSPLPQGRTRFIRDITTPN
jgi:hypothetical protein